MKFGLIFVLLACGLVFPNIALATAGSVPVQLNGSTFEVSYDATGLTVDGIEADTSTSTLTVLITTTDVSPVLQITLERSFFDSKTDGADDDFFVVAGIEEAEFEEERSETARVLTISVPPGADSIDIIAMGETGFGTGPASQEPQEIPEEAPQETPQEETPIEEPVVEPEVAEPETQCGPGTILKDGVCVLEEQQPTPEEPVVEPEVAEPETQCGPGTILKDGVCVLDERCGPGTVFKDGVCVLEEQQQSSTSRGIAFDLVMPTVAAFIIAFIIMIILWAIGRASRKKNGTTK
ncbi:MAG TPA: hypothetical protein VNK44_02015 [Candidatus Nitrosotenuis sp.]|nr:hypothetical protein [Candidatus Nitrosotenuis sp.]